MSDGVVQDATGGQSGSPAGMTAGLLLQQARVASGVHIAALAAALKVPVYKLEALESDQLDGFPDAVFVRALASSICRTLKVDAGPVLALLPHGPSPHLPADRGINAAFKDGASKKSRGSVMGSASSGSRWIPVVVVLLLVAAVALVFMPRVAGVWTMAVSSLTGGDAKTSGSDADAPAMVAEEPTVVAAAPASIMGAASVTDSVPTQGVLSTPPSAPVVAERQDVPTQSPAIVPSASSEAAAGLVVRARGETWVQIRSVSAGTSAQRVLQAGDSLAAPGSPPWAVVIGKAAVTDVSVRGEPFDLSTVARENVARFEVK